MPISHHPVCGPLPCGGPLGAAWTIPFQTSFCVCRSIWTHKWISQLDTCGILLFHKTKSCSALSCLYGELLSQGNPTTITIPSSSLGLWTGVNWGLQMWCWNARAIDSINPGTGEWPTVCWVKCFTGTIWFNPPHSPVRRELLSPFYRWGV